MTTSPYLDQRRTFPVWRVPTQTSNQNALSEREAWINQAKCRQGDPDELFVRGAQQRKAAAVCRHCRVSQQCLAAALDNREEFGVWGGQTERQRRALLRKNSHIENWAHHLAAGGTLTDN